MIAAFRTRGVCTYLVCLNCSMEMYRKSVKLGAYRT